MVEKCFSEKYLLLQNVRCLILLIDSACVMNGIMILLEL